MSDDLRQDSGSGVGRVLAALISPTAFYLLAFVVTVALTLSMFNPDWGSDARAWPHEVFTINGVFTWSTVAAASATMLIAIATLVVGLLWRPGRTRGAIVLFGVAIAATAYAGPSERLGEWVLPLAAAWVGACILATGNGWRRRAALLVGLAVLAANLFMPWPEVRIARNHLEPGYQSTATVQFQALSNPREDLLEFEPEVGAEVERNVLKGYARILVMTLPQNQGLLMLILGILAALGLTRGWGRWVVGPVLLLVPLVVAYLIYDAGTAQVQRDPNVSPWQMGLAYWAGIWPHSSMAWALGLAAAVRETVGPGRD